MAEISVLIVEPDVRYVDQIALKLLEEMESEIRLEVITDKNYYKEYMLSPRMIDVIIINETCIDESIKRQKNIKLAIILNENENNVRGIDCIYKYSNLQEIFYKIQGRMKSTFKQLQDESKKTESSLIMVYSPIGGSGKTTTALGLSSSLAELGRKVLYLNVETVQNFQYFLSDKGYIDNGFERLLSVKGEGLLAHLNGAIGTQGFDYVRPIKYSTLSYGIKDEDYLFFIKYLMESKMYEFVILDVPSDMSEFVSNLMTMSNKVIIVSNQDEYAVHKIQRLLDNIDFSNSNKFLFVCNKFNKDEENCLFRNSIMGKKLTITEYIDYDNGLEKRCDADYIHNKQIMKSTGFLLI